MDIFETSSAFQSTDTGSVSAWTTDGLATAATSQTRCWTVGATSAAVGALIASPNN